MHGDVSPLRLGLDLGSPAAVDRSAGTNGPWDLGNLVDDSEQMDRCMLGRGVKGVAVIDRATGR